jgi:hypothetical protein
MIRKLSDKEFRECACEEIAKEPYPDFSEEHIKKTTERHKAEDKWL